MTGRGIICALLTLGVCALSAAAPVHEHLRSAAQHLQAGDIPAAIESARAATFEDDSNADAWRTLAFVLNRLPMWEARQAAPSVPGTGRGGGAGETKSSVPPPMPPPSDEYVQAMWKLLELEPAYAQGSFELGSALDMRGEPGEAMRAYRQGYEAAAKLAAAVRAAAAEGDVADTSLVDKLAKMPQPSSCGLQFQLRSLVTVPPIMGPEYADPQRVEALHAEFLRNLSAAEPLELPDTFEWMPPCHLVGPPSTSFSYLGGGSRAESEAVNNIIAQALPSMRVVAPHAGRLAPSPGSNDDDKTGWQYHGLEVLKPRPPGGTDKRISEVRITGRKLRVGFVSSRLVEGHALAKSFDHLIARLGYSRHSDFTGEMEVTLISLGGSPAPKSIRGNRRIKVIDTHDLTLLQVRDKIASLQLDVLAYIDLGLATAHNMLAVARLAPVQVAMWGHPATSGSPTIDEFVGSDVELPDADSQYTEGHLERMHSMGIFFEAPEPPASPKSREAFGLPGRDAANVYLCPQALFKVHPKMDALIAGILQKDPKGIVVFVAPPGAAYMVRQLEKRWDETLPGGKLGARAGEALAGVPVSERSVRERVVVLRNKGDGYDLMDGDFFHILLTADVMIDTTPFGGGTTSLEAFALGVPIVTWPGETLAGRQTLKYYRMMAKKALDVHGVQDFNGDAGGRLLASLVANSAKDYVSKAVAVATDEALNEQLRGDIGALALQGLYGDESAVREWERYLVAAVKRRIAAMSPGGDDSGAEL